jgi:tRNA(fMet)-specific endonuclease VapC
MRYCLDTSAYSHFKRGDPQIVELIDRADWIGIPVIVMGELAVGFRLGSRRETNEAELARFVAHSVVEVLSVSEDVVNLYAGIVVDLKEAGTPLPANDIWIAAIAAHHGATILTYDRHFKSVARVSATILTAPVPRPDSDPA